MSTFSFNAYSTTLEVNIDYDENFSPSLPSPAPEFSLCDLRFSLFMPTYMTTYHWLNIRHEPALPIPMAPGWGITLSVAYTELFDDRTWSEEKLNTEPLRFSESRSQNLLASFDKHNSRFNYQKRQTIRFIFKFKVVSTKDFYPYFHQFTDETSAAELQYDCVLRLADDEEKKIFANKTILGMHSSFFRELFFGNLIEEGHNEIPLTGLKFNEFVEYVMAVYPNPRPLKLKRVPILLKLADRFGNDALIRACETFMIGLTDSEEKAKALGICNNFSLDGCFEQVVNQLSPDDLKSISLKEAKTFKPEMVLALLARTVSE